jgi:diguanylate cyclase (GGDEF)-like protein/PAS domain S-box-containing protein
MCVSRSRMTAISATPARPSILIVEDELILAKDLQRTLIDFGYDAFAIASTAGAALRCADERRPDLVMMDIRIKGPLDGIEAAGLLKKKFSAAVIYLTAHADPTMIDRAKATEPHGYLLKPVSDAELRTTVEMALYKNQLDQARAEKAALERQQEARLLEMSRVANENNERFRMMVEAVKDYAIFMLDVDGRVTSWNAGAERLKGYCEQEIIGQHFSRFHTADDIANHKPERQLEIATRTGRAADQGLRVRKDGTQFFAEVVITAVYDAIELKGFSKVVQDVTARKHSEALLSYQAAHDGLTGLPNRGLFTDRLTQAMAAALRNGRRGALLYLDLDRFKRINDSFGHSIGDRLLQSAAQRLTQCIRSTDTVSRLGGDEFVILLVDIDGDKEAAICAEKVLQLLRAPYALDAHEVHGSASIGIARYPQDGVEVEALLKNADSAMYEAKNCGRNNFQFYRKDLNSSATGHHSLENELRHAVERGEMELHYQPIIDIKSGAITGAEALVRWRHAKEGLILPARFMAIAEESGLIVPLGQWVLRTACAQRMAWQLEGLSRLRLAVNVSAVELRSKGYVAGVAAILQETGLEPEALELELTETFIMQDSQSTAVVLKSLKDVGAHLALDDFGTGYSSLSYIRRFPIDILKIDKSFVRDLSTDEADASIVSAVINMGKGLHMRVIAEGVETAEQVAFLTSHDCPEAQGYFFSRPVESADFRVLMGSRNFGVRGGERVQWPSVSCPASNAP